ncbi:MAG: NlpC/P60 family protein [Sporolactobacillus sp.]|nr:NlpC/P60 family protein [Sporolactobacillus sp.]
MKQLALPITLAGGIVLSGVWPDQQTFAVEPTAVAKRYIHSAYEWGKNDCSGFTQRVFAHFGVRLPHNSAMQARYGSPVPKSNLRAGDLVFFNTSGRGISHVGIYVGGGRMISAESERSGVRETQIFAGGASVYWEPRFVTARRLSIDSVGNSVQIANGFEKRQPAESSRHPAVNTVKQKPSAAGRSDYTVQRGDTLSAIALAAGIPLADIRRLNGLSGDIIRPGQVLRLKARTERARTPQERRVRKNHHGQKPSTLWRIMEQNGVQVLKYQKIDGKTPVRFIPGQKLHLFDEAVSF